VGRGASGASPTDVLVVRWWDSPLRGCGPPYDAFVRAPEGAMLLRGCAQKHHWFRHLPLGDVSVAGRVIGLREETEQPTR
jgi:hypothetical protein